MRGVGLDAYGAGAGAEPGFDRGHVCDDVGDGLTRAQGHAGSPAPQVDDGREDA